MSAVNVIELLQLKDPDDWTVEEIESFCQQLRHSVELCHRISNSQEFHRSVTRLVMATGEDFDSLVSCAHKNETQRRRQRRLRVLCMLSAGAIFSALVVSWMRTEPPPAPAIVTPGTDRPGIGVASHGSRDTGSEPDDTGHASPVSRHTPSTPAHTISVSRRSDTQPPKTGPWDAQLADRSQPLDDGWSPLRAQGTPPPSVQDLQQWFEPVTGHAGQFLTGQYGSRQLAGFEGVVQLRAPLDQGTALRISIPDHRNLQIYLYHGSHGLMIQHNDADDRAYHRVRHLENELTQARASVETATRDYQKKIETARPALKAIETAIGAADTVRGTLRKAELKLPAAAELLKRSEAALRKAVTAKNAAFREAPRAAARSRNAARKLRDAEAAARRQTDDKRLKQAVESAKQLALKEADLEKKAARSRTDASRTWSTVNRQKLAADRARRQVEQEIRRGKQQIKTAEQRIRQQKSRSKRILDARDAAGRLVDSAQATVTRLDTELEQAQRDAAEEAKQKNNDPNGWTIWSTHRTPGAVSPIRRILRATDSGRTHSTELRHSSEIKLCYQAGSCVVTRGDIVLLEAPMPEPPEEVYFSGRVLIDGVTLRRTGSLRPGYHFQTDPVTAHTPANLAWNLDPDLSTHFASLPDGGMELTSDSSLEKGIVASFDDRDTEFVLLDVHAEPETGIVLQSDTGQQIGCLKYTRDPDTDGLAAHWVPGDDAAPPGQPVPQTGHRTHGLPRRHFLRLLFGCGTVKAWTSEDSVHWAPVRPPLTTGSRTVDRIGLLCVSPGQAQRIALLNLEFHHFHHLASIAGPAAVPENVTLSGENYASWHRHVLQLQPASVEQADWLRACAVHSVTRGCSSDLAESLFDLILKDPIVHQATARKRYALLHEAALLTDLWTAAPRLQRMIERFAQVALSSALRRSDRHPFTTLRQTLMSMPLWTPFHISTVQPALVREEILHAVYSQQWQALRQLCRELRFFSLLQDEPLIQWARSMATQSLPNSNEDAWTAFPDEWRHPLLHLYDKELYNQVAEFDAAVSTQAYDAALQIASSADPSVVTGLVPSRSDPQLSVSLRTAVRNARIRLPEFRTRMDVAFLPAALIRVRQSIDSGNRSGVEAVALRFPDSPAAAEANAWLGDQALAAGKFQAALNHFRQAQTAGASHSEHQYASRIRLTAAMLGTRIAASAPAPLRLNDRVITTTEFTQLVDEMHAHRGTRQATPADANVRQPDTRKLKLVPQDPVIQMHDHMQDVRYFNAPPESELPAGSELGRRLDLTNAGTQMFASSGCQVAAFDSRSGQRLWTSPSTGGSSLRPRPAVPLRACVTADRVFVRQWDTAGPTLTCLSRQTGARKWSRPSSAQEALISDPMLNNSSLYALTANHSDQQQVSVRLVRFDPFSGRSLSHRELVQLRKPWWDRRLCRVSWQTHSFIASLGGVVVCSDFSGQLQWLRSQTTVPVSVESSWQRRSFDPPLINNDRVYVTQPGIQVVDCLDRVGGELRWRAVVPSLRQLAGVSTSHAVIIVNDGLQALDCENGVIAWTHACTAPVNWARCSAGRYVVYCRQQSRPDPSGDSVPQLVWLDIMDGHEVHRASLDSLSAPQASLSPIFQMDNRVWALFSRGQRDPQPDLIELTPQVP